MATIQAPSISNQAGTGPIDLEYQSAAKAWGNLNGTGTIALRDSFNVSSVTDNGTGDYTFSYTSNMANGNYMVGGAGEHNQDSYTAIPMVFGDTAPVTGSIKMQSLTTASSPNFIDLRYFYMSIHGDLA